VRNATSIRKSSFYQHDPGASHQHDHIHLGPGSLFQKKEIINQPWKIALIVSAIVGLIQGLLGVGLLLLGQKPGGGTGPYYLHYVYGAIVIFAIPVAYTYIGKDVRKAILILSIAAFIIAAAAARAMMTGLGIGQ
jgi:heme A synthase